MLVKKKYGPVLPPASPVIRILIFLLFRFFPNARIAKRANLYMRVSPRVMVRLIHLSNPKACTLWTLIRAVRMVISFDKHTWFIVTYPRSQSGGIQFMLGNPGNNI